MSYDGTPTWARTGFVVLVARCVVVSRAFINIVSLSFAAIEIFYTVWVQVQWLEKIVYTSRFSLIFQNFQNCRQITATIRRSIFHAAKSLQMPYKAKNQKITYFHNKINNPLELRLDNATG
jgi:hypothetical protein